MGSTKPLLPSVPKGRDKEKGWQKSVIRYTRAKHIKKKKSPGLKNRGFLFELVEINFNVHISYADVLVTPCILENALYYLWRWLYDCACRFRRCNVVSELVVLHHTRHLKLNIGLISPFFLQECTLLTQIGDIYCMRNVN